MAPAPAPAPAPAMDAEKEGGGGAKNQNSMVVVKTEAVCTDGDPLMVAPGLEEYEGGDTTECSSSFGDTCSGFEGEADGGEPEVNSGISAHGNGGGSSKPPRRKKVTAEWRNSVGPIMWRCQWLELRMKELSFQVSKYDRELALIEKEKKLQQAVSKANGSMSESTQIQKGHGNSIMKRRKRKRHEENVDVSLYINKHWILSYYHDKQNKGAETDVLVIDDDCGSTDGSIRGGLDTVTLLDFEDHDTISEQLTLKDTLLTIDGLQSRVHLLQDRLSKAHSGGEILALSEDNTHVRVPWNRKHTQKRSFSYMKCRFTKPQKKKNLNILLKDDDDGPALAGRPALPGRETDAHIKDANRNAEERSRECNHSREKAVTLDLLLGTDNSISNGHIGDLCKENTDDILIDNQAANEACQQFDNDKHLPSETSSKGQNISDPAEMKNISAPAEVKNTCAPVEIDSTSAPAVEPVSAQNKQELKPKKRRKKGSFFTKKQRKEASKTPTAKEKTEGTPSAAKNKTGSTPSAATGPGTMTTCSAGKKHKTGNEPTGAKKRESWNTSATSKNKETGKPSSAAKKQKTENPSSATKKQETENAPSAIKKETETESAPLNLKIEKVVLVAVNSRRSQRVRKPKVFDE